MSNDDRKVEIYKQDCGFYRYQDLMMWSRFQTAATVEAGFLYGVIKVTEVSSDQLHVLMLAAAALVFLICVLSLKDHCDARRFLRRIKTFEEGINLPKSCWPCWLRGSYLMVLAIVIINLVNIYLVCERWA